jgi:hypothetical protein
MSNEQEIPAKLTELGGSLIGAATGEIVGAAVSGALITSITGPVGLCTSVMMVTFTAGILGSKLGGTIANTIYQMSEVSNAAPISPEESRAETFQENVTKKMEEACGEVIGGLAGLLLYGRRGAILGTVIGKNIARQFQEKTVDG